VAAAAAAVLAAGAAGATHAAFPAICASFCSAARSSQSGTAVDARPTPGAAAPAGDGKDIRPIEDETAAAAAAENRGSALPADKERQIFSCGEDNVAGNLSARTTYCRTKCSRIPSAGAEEFDRIFAADRGGEGLLPSGKHESFGVRLDR
jgi:hypothetical protein